MPPATSRLRCSLAVEGETPLSWAMTEAGRARPSTSAETMRARVRSANRAAVGAMSAIVRTPGFWSTAPVCRRDVSAVTETTPGKGGGMATTTATRPARILPVMCAGMFLVLLDVTVVNVALPGIAAGLGLSIASLQWVVDGYAVALAGLLLAGGTLGDRYGHRRVLLVGFALFGVASIGCASAPGGGVLVAARVLQGIGGALLLPSTMAVIADAYPDPADQARALGIWAAVSSLALP